MIAYCERCGKSNAVKVPFTNPRDYSVTWERLCAPCRTARGVAAPEGYTTGMTRSKFKSNPRKPTPKEAAA